MYDGFLADFGLPGQLHSDLGQNFESKFFYELCLLAGVNKSHTTAFHPQTDGQTERMNRTASDAEDNCRRQPGHVAPAVAYCHGGLPHDST